MTPLTMTSLLVLGLGFVSAFQFSDPFDPSHLLTFGVATVESDSIKLTPAIGSAAGAVVYNESIYTGLSFTSQIQWNASTCGQTYGGGDGAILTSNGGGLGISGVPDVYMAAYSTAIDSFLACNWTVLSTTIASLCPPTGNPDVPYTCSAQSYVFQFVYNATTNYLRIYVDGTLKLSKAFTIPSGSYYVGISGSTGQSLYEQRISSWSFEEDVPAPVAEPVAAPTAAPASVTPISTPLAAPGQSPVAAPSTRTPTSAPRSSVKTSSAAQLIASVALWSLALIF